MKDTFDLTKFLKENKSLENLNPTFKSLNENKHVKDKIREMILAELNEDTATDEAYDPVYENELEEAKKDEEVEDVEMTDVETEDAPEEDAPEEDAPAEEAPATGGGLEDIAADMEGTEGDLMDALMKSLKIAKGMGNEKLETQIGNTLKFFVSEYIGGEEQ
jgi:CO dehydrogenase/acetyl-CoA synthase beta subunit